MKKPVAMVERIADGEAPMVSLFDRVSNVFLVEGARLRTRDLASGCLAGITRSAVLELASGVGLEPREERLTVGDLSRADEMFFTNSLMECLPVARIGEHGFGEAPGPRTRSTGARTWKRPFRGLFRRFFRFHVHTEFELDRRICENVADMSPPTDPAGEQLGRFDHVLRSVRKLTESVYRRGAPEAAAEVRDGAGSGA